MDARRHRGNPMVSTKLFVEGGGDAKSLRIACRERFTAFLKKAGLAGFMPRVIPSGSRRNAYNDYCTALKNGESALLLVDSEDKVDSSLLVIDREGYVTTALPWKHLLQRIGDKWVKPDNENDAHCHLMVPCMEAWFLADRKMLQNFYGQGFNVDALPSVDNPIEKIAKRQIYESLAKATKDCKTKSPYGKSAHSFKLLALTDPRKVMSASGWTKHFINEMKSTMGC
ncbi:MAG: DUF4276 family protein [Gallionella sp.]